MITHIEAASAASETYGQAASERSCRQSTSKSATRSLSRWCNGYWLAPSAFAIAEPKLASINHQNSSPKAMKLFVFLCQKHSACKQSHYSFPIDRRALGIPKILTGKETPIQLELGMTDSEIRTALHHLKDHNLIEVVPDPDNARYQRVTHTSGKKGVQRLAVQYRFTSEIRNVFRYLKRLYLKSPIRKEINNKVLNLKYEVPLLGEKIVKPSPAPDLFAPAPIDPTLPQGFKSSPVLRVTAMFNPVHLKPFPTSAPKAADKPSPVPGLLVPVSTTPSHLRGIVSYAAHKGAQAVKKPFQVLADVAMDDTGLRTALSRVEAAIEARRNKTMVTADARHRHGDQNL